MDGRRGASDVLRRGRPCAAAPSYAVISVDRIPLANLPAESWAVWPAGRSTVDVERCDATSTIRWGRRVHSVFVDRSLRFWKVGAAPTAQPIPIAERIASHRTHRIGYILGQWISKCARSLFDFQPAFQLRLAAKWSSFG